MQVRLRCRSQHLHMLACAAPVPLCPCAPVPPTCVVDDLALEGPGKGVPRLWLPHVHHLHLQRAWARGGGRHELSQLLTSLWLRVLLQATAVVQQRWCHADVLPRQQMHQGTALLAPGRSSIQQQGLPAPAPPPTATSTSTPTSTPHPHPHPQPPTSRWYLAISRLKRSLTKGVNHDSSRASWPGPYEAPRCARSRSMSGCSARSSSRLKAVVTLG